MRKASKSREEILKDLIVVFRNNGFHGTTLTKLTEKTGLEKASLYHYFPKGKNQMATVVIKDIIDDLSLKVLKLLNENKSPRSKLLNMLTAINDFYQGGTMLCFLTVFSIGEQNTQISKALTQALTSWIESLDDVLKELEIKHSKQQAAFAISSIQGSLILAHLKNNPNLFKNNLCLLAESWSVKGFKL